MNAIPLNANPLSTKCVYYCIKIEFQKIVSFLDTTLMIKSFLDSDDKNLLRFVTNNWIKGYDQSSGSCNISKENTIKTSMLRSDSCDYSDAYIVIKGTITVVRPDNAKRNKATAFKNNAHLSIAS